jgi:uncharacterized protein YuzE
MKLTYIPEANLLSLSWREAVETIEISERVFIDLDAEGKVVAFETWEAATILEQARAGFHIPDKWAKSVHS